jgi:hypothetical protein
MLPARGNCVLKILGTSDTPKTVFKRVIYGSRLRNTELDHCMHYLTFVLFNSLSVPFHFLFIPLFLKHCSFRYHSSNLSTLPAPLCRSSLFQYTSSALCLSPPWKYCAATLAAFVKPHTSSQRLEPMYLKHSSEPLKVIISFVNVRKIRRPWHSGYGLEGGVVAYRTFYSPPAVPQNWGWIPGEVHSLQTGSRDHSASYPVGTGDSVKRPGREAHRSSPPSAEVKKASNYAFTRRHFFIARCLILVQGQISVRCLFRSGWGWGWGWWWWIKSEICRSSGWGDIGNEGVKKMVNRKGKMIKVEQQ